MAQVLNGGAQVTVSISGEEFLERQQRAAKAAGEQGLDALLVWSRGGTSVDFYGDVLYLGNHHSAFPPNQDTTLWSGRSFSALILPVDGPSTLVSDLPEYDAETTYASDVRLTLQVPQTAATVLKEYGLQPSRVGLVGRDSFLVSHLQAMEETLGERPAFVVADEILERLRLIKSPGELDALRHATAVGARWLNSMMEFIADGRTEGEVVGEGLRTLAINGGSAYDTAIASGARSRNFFSRNGIPTWTADKRLNRGDIVHIDAWASVDGYYTDFDRSTVVGRKPTDRQREVLEGSIAIVEHIIDGVRPGVTIGEVYARGAQWLVDNGFGEHRAELGDAGTDFGQLFPAFGHSVGLGLERPYIIDGDPTVIEPNMVLAVEALIGHADVGGAAFEQQLIVGADGVEVISADCPSRWWD
jgi:Xaa-Pro dipeptidase